MWGSFVFGLGVLIYAAMFDFKHRQVSNRVWLFAYPIGGGLSFLGVGWGLLGVEAVLVSLGCALGLGVILFFLGFYGGADVKALIFIGLTVPRLPFIFNPVPGLALAPVLVVFFNATLLTAVWPLSIFILNLKDILKANPLFEGINLSFVQKGLVLFTARKVPLDMVGWRYFPAEKIVLQGGNPTRKLCHFVRAEADLSNQLAIIEANKALYQNGVLASPTIPAICFFTLALGTALFGNLFFWVGALFGTISL
ncbi:MAG: prepilin peptidase [Nitrososphaerota archaeon]|nr:prepilin peptidase [Nitrososphaerota archaeon]